MEAFAASAATAVATAQNVAQLASRRSIEAAETERGRWARELHDETLQELAALKIALASARRATEAGDACRRCSTTRSRRSTRRSATSGRSSTTSGPPRSTRSASSRRWRRSWNGRGCARGSRSPLVVDLAFEAGRSPNRLAPAIELAAYRLVQEALTNAVRHASASHVGIELVEEDDAVGGTVTDDGLGFDPDDGHAGFGLISMAERATLVGGNIEVESSPDGTTIRFTLPVSLAPGRLRHGRRRLIDQRCVARGRRRDSPPATRPSGRG